MDEERLNKENFLGLKVITGLIVVLAVLVACLLCDVEIVVVMESALSTYFNETRISFVITFFSVVIAMYITMTSILAISATKIMEALLKKELERKFLSVIKWSLGSSVFSALMCVFLDQDLICYGVMLSLSILVAVFYFIYFISLLFIIFEYNIENMDREIDEHNNLKDDLKITLKYIRDEINKKRD